LGREILPPGVVPRHGWFGRPGPLNRDIGRRPSGFRVFVGRSGGGDSRTIKMNWNEGFNDFSAILTAAGLANPGIGRWLAVFPPCGASGSGPRQSRVRNRLNRPKKSLSAGSPSRGFQGKSSPAEKRRGDVRPMPCRSLVDPINERGPGSTSRNSNYQNDLGEAAWGSPGQSSGGAKRKNRDGHGRRISTPTEFTTEAGSLKELVAFLTKKRPRSGQKKAAFSNERRAPIFSLSITWMPAVGAAFFPKKVKRGIPQRDEEAATSRI